MATNRKQQSGLFNAVGVSGLPMWNGWLADEFLPDLAGERGRRVLREMLDNDAAIGALMFSVQALVRSVEWTVSPGGQETKHQDTADYVEDCLGDMDVTWHDTLGEILTFLPYGWALQEQIYKRRNGVDSKYNDGRIGWKSWSLRGQDSLLRWETDPDGTVLAMVQLGPPDFQEHIIPLSKCLHFRTTTNRGNPEGRGILRNAWRSWYVKKNIEQFQAIGIERDLCGYPVLYVPDEITIPMEDAQGNPTGENPEYTNAKNVITSIRRGEQEGVVLPSGRDEHGQRRWELALLSTGGQRQLDIEKVIERLDNRILMVAMADFITLGHDARGSQALAQQRGEFFTTALDTWLQIVESQVNEVAIPRLLKLNGMETDEPPRLEHGDINRNDLLNIGQFLSFIQQAGVEIDTRMDGPLAKKLLGMARLPDPPDPQELVLEEPEAEQEQLPTPMPQQPGEPTGPSTPQQTQQPQPATRGPKAPVPPQKASETEGNGHAELDAALDELVSSLEPV